MAETNNKPISNFEKVLDFNKSFGIQIFNKIQKNITKDDPKLIKYRLSLICEEVEELEEAVKKHDYNEMVDALSDILYVVYGMGTSIGVNLDNAFDIVHESNMSKLCNTEEEAIKTVQWYKDNEKRYDSPNYRKSDDGTKWVVYNKSTKKILKSINYKKVNFNLDDNSLDLKFNSLDLN
jgi:predicted HAD superfamily Cof-like phosphohydrolase